MQKRESGVKRSAIADYERERSISKTMVEKIKTALEAQGIEFTNGKRPGVRIKK